MVEWIKGAPVWVLWARYKNLWDMSHKFCPRSFQLDDHQDRSLRKNRSRSDSRSSISIEKWWNESRERRSGCSERDIGTSGTCPLSHKFLKIITLWGLRSLKCRYVTFCNYYIAGFCATFQSRERPIGQVWSSRVTCLFERFWILCPISFQNDHEMVDQKKNKHTNC